MSKVESKTTRVEDSCDESSDDESDASSDNEDEDSCDESSDDESDASSDNEDEESSDKSSVDESNPSSDNENENVILYHYTNDNGAQGISKDKMIKASTDKNNDAVFGEEELSQLQRRLPQKGVYLTAMDPYTYSKEEIIRNNYDDGLSIHKSIRFHDKADSAIEVSVPVSKVSKVDNTDRDVYLYDGHLNLDEYDHSVLKTH